MVEQVADGVTWVRGSRTNLYVIDDGNSVCLIDTGYPGDVDTVMTALEKMERSLSDVSAVLLTHAHVDHIGSAEMLRSEHGATVHAHAEEAAHARGEREERISTSYMVSRLWWPKMISFVANALRAGATAVQHVREVSVFEDTGVGLDLPGSPVPVFTPGHTTGHCAFHLPDRGALITGDALVTHDSLTQQTGPRLLHRAFNLDQDGAVRSLDRLRTLEADVLLPGHGEPFHGSPAEAVETAISHLA